MQFGIADFMCSIKCHQIRGAGGSSNNMEVKLTDADFYFRLFPSNNFVFVPDEGLSLQFGGRDAGRPHLRCPAGASPYRNQESSEHNDGFFLADYLCKLSSTLASKTMRH